MNHDDTSANPMFESSSQMTPGQMTKSTTLEPDANLNLAIEGSNALSTTLAATQEFKSRQAELEESQSLKTPVVENFLPSPNRLLAFSSLGLVGALALGTFVSTLVTYRTTVKAQAVVHPANEFQVIQASEAGTVESILVQNYDLLKPDQVVATLDNSALRTEIFNTKAQIAQLQEQIGQVNSEIIALEQRQSAQSSNPSTQFSIGEAQALNYSKGLLLAHRSELTIQLSYQNERLNQAEQKIDNMVVRSPAAGILYELALNTLGQTIKPDDPFARVIPDGTTLEIRALVSDTDIKNIKVGHVAQINLSNCKTFSFTPLKGQVSSIEPTKISQDAKSVEVTESKHTVTVQADAQEVQTGSRTCKLLPGTEGEITIITKQEKLLDFFLRKLRLKPNV